MSREQLAAALRMELEGKKTLPVAVALVGAKLRRDLSVREVMAASELLTDVLPPTYKRLR